MGIHQSTCAIIDSVAKCWGRNSVGQLGDGTTSDRYTPTPVNFGAGAPTPVYLGDGCRGYNGGAVMSDGTVRMWGKGSRGMVGNGQTSNVHTPTIIDLGSPVTQIGTLDDAVCWMLASGQVKCVGYNAQGALGDGSTTDRTTPVLVNGISSDNPATRLTCGYNHCLVVLADGTMKAWGHGTQGQLGDGSASHRYSPVTVNLGQSAGQPVLSIAAGTYHSLAVLADGTVKAWGYNNHGEIGDGTTTNRRNGPVTINVGGPARMVSATAYSSCAVLVSGQTKCWGRNNYGQLGDGSTSNRNSPVDITSSLHDVPIAIVGGHDHRCWMFADDTIQCSGSNSYGRLGDGTTTNRNVPTTVQW